MPHHFGWSCHLTWYIMEKGMDPTHACMACPKHLQPSHNCTDGRSSLLFFTVAFSEVSRHVVSQNNPSAVGVHFKNLILKDFFFLYWNTYTRVLCLAWIYLKQLFHFPKDFEKFVFALEA